MTQSFSLAPSLRYMLLSGSVNTGREIPRAYISLLPWTIHIKFRTDIFFDVLGEILCI